MGDDQPESLKTPGQQFEQENTKKQGGKGIGALGYGVQKLSAVGHVYDLNDIADFPGGYSEARAGLTIAKGVGALYIRNDKGVVIELKTHADGVALSVGVSGIGIEME